MNESLITSAIAYIDGLFKNIYDGHDVDHSLRVYHNALRIAELEGCCDMEIVALAAILHDADDHKLFSTENNENARIFLNQQHISADEADRICEVINSVSFSRNRGRHPETQEGKIVQDADRLDALGAVGIARTYAFGGRHGRSIDESTRHFYEKLLLLKDEMNTSSGKKMAESRHAFLEMFLAELKNETDSP
ncbi:MAG: HD domain-containing protein [Clostridia bacterium]|nr:HD domain-containing protein [Clostridia bacterium]